MNNIGKGCGSTVAMAMLAIASPCHAQSAAATTFFRDVNARVSPPAPSAIATLLKEAFEKSREKNPQVCVPATIAIADLKPATADARVWIAIRDGKMLNAWTVRADMTGCAIGFANYLVVRLPDESAGHAVYREIGFSRGTTYAGFSISRDATNAAAGAMVAALTKAKVDVKSCIGPLIVGTREVIKDSAGPDIFGVRFSGDWKERWRFQDCGHDVDVPIHFKADGQGGANFDVVAGEAVVR